jgi:hypothetical protein
MRSVTSTLLRAAGRNIGKEVMGTFKMMTWNVENLFQPAAEVTPAAHERFGKKLALLAGVIGCAHQS